MTKSKEDPFSFLSETFAGTDVLINSEPTPEQESAADKLRAMRDEFLQNADQNDNRLFYFSTTGSQIDRKALIGKEPFQDAAPYRSAQAAERAKFRSFYNRICLASKTNPLDVAERPPVLGFFNWKDRCKIVFRYEGWIAISSEQQLAEIEYMRESGLWPNLAVLNQTSAWQTDWYLSKMSRLHCQYPDLFPDRSLIIK